MRLTPNRLANGYTLIEILVVLFIISIVSSVALLSINQNHNRELENFANELTQTLSFAEEQAMLKPSVLGLNVSQQAFQFATYQPGATKSSWSPLTDAILGKHAVPQDIELDLRIGEQSGFALNPSVANLPQIVISTNGDMTPFVIYIAKKGEKPRYKVEGDADGKVTNTLLS